MDDDSERNTTLYRYREAVDEGGVEAAVSLARNPRAILRAARRLRPAHTACFGRHHHRRHRHEPKPRSRP